MIVDLTSYARRGMKSRFPGLGRSAFTLLELLCVITIIALLASMLMPAVGTMQQKADSIRCAANLRGIGVAVQLYLQDHNFYYPEIQNPIDPPVYPASDSSPMSMTQAFGPYGVTDQTMRCPSDIKSPNPPGSSYQLYGTSYDWKPTLDDENQSSPLVYGRRMGFGAQVSGSSGAVIVKLSKVRQVFDDTNIHFGHTNALYADGHVVSFTSPTTH
jgi:prepilin-type N-terminal cleavage/methylation domain-containing protein/prepilin-type processing-associated H-X9-DG protein